MRRSPPLVSDYFLAERWPGRMTICIVSRKRSLPIEPGGVRGRIWPTSFSTSPTSFVPCAATAWWQMAVELLIIGAVVYWVVRFFRRNPRRPPAQGRRIPADQPLPDRQPRRRPVWARRQIEYLYGKFLLFASRATIVVFQPELRRASCGWARRGCSAASPAR